VKSESETYKFMQQQNSCVQGSAIIGISGPFGSGSSMLVNYTWSIQKETELVK
jgi:ABC-type lipoprotein export system ATPase subunit